MEIKYVLYENWRADKKVVIHDANCGHAKESLERIKDNWIMNNNNQTDRWFGYFYSLKDIVVFASVFPNRRLCYCKHCFGKHESI